MSEDLQKPQMDMTAKKVIIDITSDQSENHPDTTVDQSQSGGDQSDEESWDTMFDDNGDCLDPAAMEEVSISTFQLTCVYIQCRSCDFFYFTCI